MRAWAAAFFAQAESDWPCYQQLSEKLSLPACHALHALQMTLEKLGKALRLAEGSLGPGDVARSHLGLAKYLQAARFDHELASFLGMTRGQFAAACRQMTPLVERLERLHPQLASGPNVEYPWARPDGRVVAPARFSFGEINLLRTPSGGKLLNFSTRVFEYHGQRTFAGKRPNTPCD